MPPLSSSSDGSRRGFSPRQHGQPLNRPLSLAVDALIFEAYSRKSMQDWEGAADCLREAIALAEAKMTTPCFATPTRVGLASPGSA